MSLSGLRPRILVSGSLLLAASILGAAITPVASAMESDPPPEPAGVEDGRFRFHGIPGGTIGSEDVVIRAEDGSFVLTHQTPWASPFQADCWCDELAGAWPPEDRLIDAYRTALRHGARLVRIDVPGRRRSLHGILMLCPATETAYGPGSRSYRILVPPKYAAQSTEGLISVVYELMPYRVGSVPTDAAEDPRWYSWMLWLSEEPFPGQ